MKELDKIFFGQSLIWREGFFYAIELGNDPKEFKECIEYLDTGNQRLYFKEGWDYAVSLHRKHNKELNGS